MTATTKTPSLVERLRAEAEFRNAPQLGDEDELDTSRLATEAANEIERLTNCISDEQRDAKRYRALRGLVQDIRDDEAGIEGLAFSYQVPLDVIQTAGQDALTDAVVDAAIANGEVE